jgi:hypothetical protein
MASVTVAAASIPNWELSPDVQLRIYPLQNFVAADNTIESAGVPSEDAVEAANNYVAVACTLLGSTLTIASCVLKSTTDSLDNPGALYGAFFYTTEGEKIGAFAQFATFALPNSPASTTWAAIAQAQKGTL